MYFSTIQQTPFGPVSIAYTGGGHASVHTGWDTYQMGHFEVQKGIRLSLSLHLYRDETGNFVPKDPVEMILSKMEYKRFNDRVAAPTHRQKVLTVLPPLVTAFLNAHPEELAAEDVEDIRRDRSRIQKDIDDLNEKLAPLLKERARLSALLEEVEG